MIKYVRHPPLLPPSASAEIGDDFVVFDPNTMNILEEDWDAQPTGLLDAEGYPIHRLRERVRCGFIPGEDE